MSVDVVAEGHGQVAAACHGLSAITELSSHAGGRGSVDAPDLGLLSSRAGFKPMFRVVAAVSA